MLQVRRALHWLAAKERVQQQRLAAALVLKELAAASPAVFNMHVRQFIEVIWAGIRDLALPVRIASVQALQVTHRASAKFLPLRLTFIAGSMLSIISKDCSTRHRPHLLCRQCTCRSISVLVAPAVRMARAGLAEGLRMWQACLVLVEKRETRYRVQWYYRLFEETRLGLQMAQPLDRSHGCLLALGELLAHTGVHLHLPCLVCCMHPTVVHAWH